MGNATVNRKYPRAGIDQAGVMTVRGADQRRLRVAIRSISCEGVGVALLDPRCPLERRAMVTVDFRVDGNHFEIPGLIAWVAPDASPPTPVDVGVRFQLAMVPLKTREAYARWIVAYLGKQAPHAAPTDRA